MKRVAASMSFAVAAAVLAFGCIGTETGNPSADEPRFAVAARTSDLRVASLRAPGGAFVIEGAWVVLGDLRFERADVCDTGGATEVQVAGPTFADLLSPVPMAPALADGSYCRLRIPLERAALPAPVGVPAEIADHSILVQARRGSDGVPIVLRSRLNIEADARSPGAPFEVAAMQRAFVLAFDLAAWLAGVDGASAIVDPDGTIRIEEGTNDVLLDAFEASVERAVDLFRDPNRNAALEPEEEGSGPIAEGIL